MTEVELELGDIIKINSRSELLNDQIFMIEYIDNTEIQLVNEGMKEIIYTNEGTFIDPNILSIELLSRSEKSGYVQQNDLLVDTWVNIYVGGDLPEIYTGRITNIENDQVEIKLVNDKIIYIDFAYQGIPKNLLIDKIELRSSPNTLSSREQEEEQEEEEQEQEEQEQEEEKFNWADDVSVESLNEDYDIPDNDEIIFGDDLEDIIMMVEIPEELKKFSLEKQTDDLLDDLLSTIPTEKRTPYVLSKVHTMIDRFVQLRSEFTKRNDTGEYIIKPNLGNYSNLQKNLINMKEKVPWLFPVTKLNKKIFTEDKLELDNTTIIEPYKELLEEYKLTKSYEETKTTSDEVLYYDYLNRLKNYYIPYTEVNHDEPYIYDVRIGNNTITGIVSNTDDEDFSSYVINNGEISRKKMFFQEYTPGHMTKNDLLSVHSVVVLPEKLIQYYLNNIKHSDILSKTGLNYLPLWNSINSKSDIKSVNLEKKNKGLFTNDIVYYPNEKENYYDYLDKIIPTNYDLFKSFSSLTNNKTTTYDIYKDLEVFLIHKSNITKEIAQEAESIVQKNVLDFNLRMAEKEEEYKVLNEKHSQVISVFDGMFKNDELKQLVVEKYSIENEMIQYSELLKNIEMIDNGKVFISALAIDNENLILDYEIPDLVVKKPSEEQKEEMCNNYIISKKYTSKEDLENDNDKIIYFDSKYDDTYYEIIKEYQIEGLSDPYPYVEEQLIKVNGMNKTTASRYAMTLLEGKKRVIDNDYAVYLNNEEHSFFIRKNNRWEPSDVSPDVFSDDIKTLCNLRDTCFVSNTSCITEEQKENELNKKIYDDLIDTFHNDISERSEEIKKNIQTNLESFMNQIEKIKENKFSEEIKYTTSHYDMGLQTKEYSIRNSPYQILRDKILGQNDFVKKQNDIQKFVQMYTRPAKDNEDMYWCYCIEEDVKLIPTFLVVLSDIYISNPDHYIRRLQEIMRNQGEISDDGDMVVDKHSGYIISRQGFSNEEGYTKDGFKMVTREVEEEDIKIHQDGTLVNNDSELMKTIRKVVNAMENFLGIHLKEKVDNIVIETNKLILSGLLIQSKEEYEKKLKLKKTDKKPESYKTLYNQSIIIGSLSYMLIFIQSSIPEIRSKKTHPTCKMSFSGFPFGNASDNSGIQYLVCVAKSIQSKIVPWSGIKKLSEEKMIKKIESVTKFIVDDNINIRDMFDEKNLYLQENDVEDIPDEHSIQKWEEFLPPLVDITNSTFENVSENLYKRLQDGIITGNITQDNLIFTLRSKVIYATMDIVKNIQGVVKKNIKEDKAILYTKQDVPFLSNACCEGKNENTIDYFIRENGNIKIKNNIVNDISMKLKRIKNLSKAPFLFHSESTRRIKTDVSNDYDNEIMYILLIKLLKTKLSSRDEPFYSLQRDYKLIENYSFENKIEWFISQRIVPSKELLNTIMNILNDKERILSNKKLYLSNNIKISSFLVIDNKEERHVEIFKDFNDILTLETDKHIKEKQTKDFRIKTDKKSKELEENIMGFMYGLPEKLKKRGSETVINLKNLLLFEEDDSIFDKIITFMNNIIYKISVVLPKRVIHKKLIDIEKIRIHKHWNLSGVHMKDIKQIFMKHYERFNRFIGNRDFDDILEHFISKNRIIYELSKLIKYSEIQHIDEMDKQRTIISLYRYFILSLFDCLIECSKGEEEYEDDEERIKKEMSQHWIIECFDLIQLEKKSIDYNYKTLKERINRSKEKEKDIMTEKLQSMTDEERSVDNLFKKHKLEQWGIGEQKGFKVYQGETYDEERIKMDKQILSEMKLGKIDGVSNMNRDIYNIELEQEELETKRIEEEENDISHLGEDNDGYGEEYDDEM